MNHLRKIFPTSINKPWAIYLPVTDIQISCDALFLASGLAESAGGFKKLHVKPFTVYLQNKRFVF